MATEEDVEQFYVKVSRVCLHQNELGILYHILSEAIADEARTLENRRGLNPDKLNALKRLKRKLGKNWHLNMVTFQDLRRYVPYAKSG